MAGAGGRLRKRDRILQPRDFERVAREGQRSASRSFVVLVRGRPGSCGPPGARIGITASRRVGKAVARNRVKRWVREWFRTRRGEVGRSADIIVIARPAALEMGFSEVDRELSRLTRRALSKER